jgi:hypothetical protein
MTSMSIIIIVIDSLGSALEKGRAARKDQGNGEGLVLKRDSAPSRREQKEKKTSHEPELRIVRLRHHHARVYDDAARQALIILWDASDRVGSKRLKVLIPVLLAALQQHQRLSLEPASRNKLAQISTATIDRLLIDARADDSTTRARRLSLIPQGSRPIRPGFRKRISVGCAYLDLETPFASRTAGSQPPSLALMDFFSGWTEQAPLTGWAPSTVTQVLSELCRRVPFTLRTIVVSPDLEFSFAELERYCSSAGLTLTRLRPENAPGKSEGPGLAPLPLQRSACPGDAATEDAFVRANIALSSFMNFFQVSFRPVSSHAAAARDPPGKRRYVLATPCMRLLSSNDLSAEQKARLAQAALPDPLDLLAEVRQMRSHLTLLATGLQLHTPNSGQEKPPARARHWRTRPDAFEEVGPTIQAWLQADPNQTVRAIFQRLRREFPGVYREGQLRSLQRRIKDWRGPGSATRASKPMETNNVE